jgi:Xaa-Pro aminopeptidase
MSKEIAKRIAFAREALLKEEIDALIVFTSDPHQSEYLADHWKTREYLTGFTGSQGTLVLTQNFAGLWVDSRYYLQAEEELKGSGIEMRKMEVQGTAEYLEWLLDHMEEGQVVGVNGKTLSVKAFENLEEELDNLDIALNPNVEIFAYIWPDRPALPKDPVFEYPTSYAGLSRAEKLQQIKTNMEDIGVDHYLLCALDDIAWTLNIRGTDVECNPVVLSYLLIGTQESIWFVDPDKVPSTLKESLRKDGVFIMDYQAVYEIIAQLDDVNGILCDPNTTSWDLYDAIQNIDVVEDNGMVMAMKAIKNETELQHLRETMRYDGMAILRTEIWLRDQIQKGETLGETQIAAQLKKERAKYQPYQGESFEAIVGYNANGAIVHYRATEDKEAQLSKEGILLVDSGGQYLTGTTDITRTWALAEPTEEQKKCYTAVLKGHIALDSAVFPKGTRGVQLDILARKPLWDLGLNYGHGTGHGIGFFLNVHEPPQGFVANLSQRGTTALLPGMVTSNEPGYYQSGEFGIRIENLILTVEKNEGFLAFETLTLYPLEISLLEETMLTSSEKEWINAYHSKVLEQLRDLCTEEEWAFLRRKCDTRP